MLYLASLYRPGLFLPLCTVSRAEILIVKKEITPYPMYDRHHMLKDQISVLARNPSFLLFPEILQRDYTNIVLWLCSR